MIRQILFGLTIVLVVSTAGMATPTLQLDIRGGTYDWSSETVIASGNVFTLYAYLIPNSKNTITDEYFIAAAVDPQYGPSGGSLGSFVFNGQTIQVTSNMTFGTPPLEGLLAAWDPGDLAKHGIYPTYFSEFAFHFNSAPVTQSGIYNTENHAGQGPTTGTGMYYKAFTVDVSNLQNPYRIHFDLYNTGLKNGDEDVTEFAPFSHDAESRAATHPQSVPEPNTLSLLATGGLGLLVALKRSRPVGQAKVR